jgi:hypothetical protein
VEQFWKRFGSAPDQVNEIVGRATPSIKPLPKSMRKRRADLNPRGIAKFSGPKFSG